MINQFKYDGNTKEFKENNKVNKQNHSNISKKIVLGSIAMSALSTYSPADINGSITTSFGHTKPITEVTNKSEETQGERGKYRLRAISKGESILSDNSYSKNEIDLKLENINGRFESKFELLSEKIDNGFRNQSLQLDSQLQSFKVQQMETRKEIIRWYIGTAIAVVGLFLAYLAIN